MDKIKQIRSILIIVAALGWWGMWFPELTVWGGAVRVADQEYVPEEVREIYSGLQQADRSQIRIKSKLLSAIDQYLQTK